MSGYLCATCGTLMASKENVEHGGCGPVLMVGEDPGPIQWCNWCNGFYNNETTYLHEECHKMKATS